MLTMHGAVWLQLRTEGVIAERAQRAAVLTGAAVIVLFALGGVWIVLGGIEGYRIVQQPAFDAMPNPLAKEVVRDSGALLAIYSNVPVAILAPIAGFAGIGLAMLLARVARPGLAYIASSIGLAGIISTAGLSMFPFVMPSSSQPVSSLTVWDAPSSHLTLTVMFWAVVIFLPIVLGYTVWCYRRMWGKVTVEEIQNRSHSAY